jgi:hypothetical protein
MVVVERQGVQSARRRHWCFKFRCGRCRAWIGRRHISLHPCRHRSARSPPRLVVSSVNCMPWMLHCCDSSLQELQRTQRSLLPSPTRSNWAYRRTDGSMSVENGHASADGLGWVKGMSLVSHILIRSALSLIVPPNRPSPRYAPSIHSPTPSRIPLCAFGTPTIF